MERTLKPKGRTADLHVEQVGDELVVFQTATSEVHRLNPTLALIWESADGSRTVEEIAAAIRETLHAPCDSKVVTLGLRQLERSGLLCEGSFTAEPLPTRRELSRTIANLGLSAAALPVLASILAPTPAMARSQVATTWTPQQVQSDLTRGGETAISNINAFRNSPAAQQDLAGAVNYGVDGLKQSRGGNTQGAQTDFQKSEDDLGAFFRALGM